MGMHVHNLYCDPNGESHWRDIDIEWVNEGPEGKTSARQFANGIIFLQTQAEHDRPWHPAPRRQYIINLDAGVELTASDGESRKIGAGEIVLVEDTSGKGHLSKSINHQMRHSIFVPIE
jgi:hypothetical protein